MNQWMGLKPDACIQADKRGWVVVGRSKFIPAGIIQFQFTAEVESGIQSNETHFTHG